MMTDSDTSSKRSKAFESTGMADLTMCVFPNAGTLVANVIHSNRIGIRWLEAKFCDTSKTPCPQIMKATSRRAILLESFFDIGERSR